MKQRIHAKIKAFIVIVSMLFTSTVYPVTATTVFGGANSSDKYKYTESKVKNDDMQDEDEFDYGEEEPVVEDDGMILRYVDKAHFNSSKHVKRIPQLEDLNTYVFENTDGTRTIYLMYENVKFKDKNGVVKEKDITLKRKTKGYGTVQNNVDLLIPDNPVNGIDLEYSGFGIKLTPLGLEGTSTASKDDNSVEYPEAYGKNTKLKYTPLLSGIKEDIILYEYTPDASYTFILETGGLTVYSDDKGYYLADKRKTNPIFYLGDIVIYDAIGKPDVGTMKVDTIAAGRKYLLTVTANDEFLSDPDTVYPVTIDPSVTVSDNNASGSIIDAPIFKGYPNSNFGTFIYDRVGTPSASYGIGRTAIKLPGLISQNEYKGINANQIKSVYFYVREASGTSTQYINLYQLTGNTTWTETSVTWNNIGAYSTAANYGTSMGSNQWAKFDITNMVKAWKNQASLANAGFIMTNANEANDKCFLSSEYSTASYRPYVVMTYNTGITLNYASFSIAEGVSKTLIATTRPSGQVVTWTSENTSVATVTSTGKVTGVRSGTTTITSVVTDCNGIKHSASCKVNVHIPNGVYSLKNVYNGMYLDVTGGGITAGTEMQQWSGTSNNTNRNKLFKITYLGTYGDSNLNYYSIRSMTNSAMGVSAPYTSNGKNVTLQPISTVDKWNSISYSQTWAITRYGTTNVTLRNGTEAYKSFLATPSNSINGERVLTSSTVNTNSRWILEPYMGETIEGIGVTSLRTKLWSGETYYYDAYMYSSVIGKNGPVTYRVAENNYSETDKATIDAMTGKLTALKSGTIKLGLTYSGAPRVWWWTIEIGKGTFKNLLIYQTRNRERMGYEINDKDGVIPSVAEDLTYGQKSTKTLLTNGTLITSDDLYANGEVIPSSKRVTLVKNFFISQIQYEPTFSTILSQMLEHFADGSGTDYSNDDLTEAVRKHPNTQAYVNEVIKIVKEQIDIANGDVEKLYYDEQLWVKPNLRKEQVIVKAMNAEITDKNNLKVYLPTYGFDNGVPGLTLAIDGWYGNKIEIETLTIRDSSYSGTLRFTFYDHFGLDTNDLSVEKSMGIKPGIMPGFRQWYILQHWKELGATVQPKPFVTVVSYTVPISGTF